MTTESFSEIQDKCEIDDDLNNSKSEIKLFCDSINKLIYKRGFYYIKILDLLHYKDTEDFYFCNDCNKSYIFSLDPKNIIELDSILYSCDCINERRIYIENLYSLKKI